MEAQVKNIAFFDCLFHLLLFIDPFYGKVFSINTANSQTKLQTSVSNNPPIDELRGSVLLKRQQNLHA